MENINNYIKPITKKGTQIILEQMSYCLCKIFNKEIIGIGFFCKFFGRKAIITSYQTLDENYFIYNNNINFSIGDFNEKRTIYIDIKRQVYCNKEDNITIIELKNEDNINYFIELDNDIYRDTIYEKESIYVLNYLNNTTPSVSYGIIKNIDNNIIKTTCYIESGMNFAPILNTNNNKVIGIWNKNIQNNNSNNGIFLIKPVCEFMEDYCIKLKKIMDNIEPNNNFINNNNFQNENQNLSNNNYEEEFDPRPKLNIIFSNTQGTSTNIVINSEATIDQLLDKYLIKMNKIFLRKTNKIFFLYNSSKLKYGDKTKAKKFFKGAPHPKIFVNDVNNICSSFKMDIIFKISSGITHVLRHYDTYDYPISKVLKKYLTEIKREDIINDKNNKIYFLYNAKRLKFDDVTPVSYIFNYLQNPIQNPSIIVVDSNNSLFQNNN
jgi:hypothetical protein